jgi:PAS domain S-box-containing protein
MPRREAIESGEDGAVSTADVAALQASHRQLRAIMDSAREYAIIGMDPDGLVTAWNVGGEMLVGWTAAEALGREAAIIFPVEDRQAGVPEREMAAARAEGRALDERWHVRKDGSRFWAEGEIVALRDEGTGALEGFLKILRDRTSQRHAAEELKEAASALRESESRFRHMADSAPALIWMTDAEGQMTFANMHYDYLFGRSAAEMLGEGWKTVVLPEDAEPVHAAFLQAFAERQPFRAEMRVRDKAGNVRWLRCEGVPRLDDSGAFLGYTGCNVDITEAKAAELALRESEMRLKLAMDAGGMAVWESQGAAIKSSPELNRLLGFAPDEEVSAERIRSRYAPGERDRLAELARHAIARGDRFGQAEIRCAWDDQVRWLLLRAEIIYGPGSTPPSIIGVALDITERKEAEEQLRLLNQELGHRVKNSLAIAQAIVSQSLRSAATPAEARDAILQRLTVLSRANDILTGTSWKEAPITQVVENAVRVHRDRPDRIRVSGPDLLLAGRAALGLALALHELSTNAVKYGALSVDTGQVKLAWTVDGEGRFSMIWREQGGPIVTAPSRKGFGSRLIETAFGDLRGSSQLRYEPEGLVWRLEAPLNKLTEH